MEEEELGWFNIKDTVLSLRSSSYLPFVCKQAKRKMCHGFIGTPSFVPFFLSFSAVPWGAFLSLCFPKLAFFACCTLRPVGQPPSLHTLIHIHTHSFF